LMTTFCWLGPKRVAQEEKKRADNKKKLKVEMPFFIL
jgi:hypothetical protein